MKKLISFSCILFVSASLLAQAKKIVAKPKPVIKKTTPQPIVLKTLMDSASYSIGLSIASFCKQQGITKPNTGLCAKSITDVMDNKPTLITDAVSNEIINKLLTEGKSAPKPATKPVISKSLLKTANDSASYAIGLNHASFFKQQGITNLNTALINKAISDVLGNKPLLINDRMANMVMNKLIIQIQENKVKPAIDAGKAFLENNKKRPEVKTTSSGLQYEVIREGTGIKPTAADTFVCHYRGTLINGTKFDASYDRNQPLELPVTSVIKGWTEGLQLMPVGSKYIFYIPYELAYGPFDNNSIPGGSVLIFEVELLNVKKHTPPEPIKPAN
jgi:FKBP-type peptidyl-prolyl cis-trans isomerase FklB